MELIDVVDENNELLGITEEREIVHKKNLWHRLVSCWIMNERGEILLQKRSHTKIRNPVKWARTGGHVNYCENVEEAIIREIKEEIGIDILKTNLKLLWTYKSNSICDRYFGYDFFVNVTYKIDEYVLQEDEVSDIQYMTIEKMESLKEQNNRDYSFSDWDDDFFNKIIQLLKNERKKVISVEKNNNKILQN